ncbi:MAG: hypothetical protein LH472_09705 [Pyrinomonadaceae bacterium]|nr:hypothetical protein [Pyrinomonadaceae bacterium]
MMLKESNFTVCAAKARKTVVFFSLCALLLIMAACYQRFERMSVKAIDEGISFSHPQMEEAMRQGNLCVFGEMSVSRQSSPNNYSEQMWYLQNTESGFQPSTEPMKKPFIIYGESLPQTSVTVEPKPLREGKYRVSGVVVIYNQKRELLKDLSFNDEFVLKTDASGKLTVSPAEK